MLAALLLLDWNGSSAIRWCRSTYMRNQLLLSPLNNLNLLGKFSLPRPDDPPINGTKPDQLGIVTNHGRCLGTKLSVFATHMLFF